MKEKKIKHNNLRLLRLLHGDLSQRYVAYKSKVSQPAYCKMERGELIPSETTLKNVCELYGLENHEIIFLPHEVIKERLTGISADVEIRKSDKLKMEVETLRRKLKVMLNGL